MIWQRGGEALNHFVAQSRAALVCREGCLQCRETERPRA
jgi:hypothetical protein